MLLKKLKWLHSPLLNLHPLHSNGIMLHELPCTFHLVLDHIKVNVEVGAKGTAVMLLTKVYNGCL
jgi:hypothetical protein